MKWQAVAAVCAGLVLAGCAPAADPLGYETAAVTFTVAPEAMDGGVIRVSPVPGEDGTRRLTVRLTGGSEAEVLIRGDGTAELAAGDVTVPVSAEAAAGLRLWADCFSLRKREGVTSEDVTYAGRPAVSYRWEGDGEVLLAVVDGETGYPVWVEGRRGGFSVSGAVSVTEPGET